MSPLLYTRMNDQKSEIGDLLKMLLYQKGLSYIKNNFYQIKLLNFIYLKNAILTKQFLDIMKTQICSYYKVQLDQDCLLLPQSSSNL